MVRVCGQCFQISRGRAERNNVFTMTRAGADIISPRGYTAMELDN